MLDFILWVVGVLGDIIAVCLLFSAGVVCYLFVGITTTDLSQQLKQNKFDREFNDITKEYDNESA